MDFFIENGFGVSYLNRSHKNKMDMKQYIANKIVGNIVSNPELLSKFKSLRVGQIVSQEHKDIVHTLVMNCIDSPETPYDPDFRHSWSVRDFLPSIKNAIH
jgi:hypothetical protein